MPRSVIAAASPAKPEGRKKTKSRNGCQRCKVKRLKCDETKPGCINCRNRDITCPGYEKSLKWSTKYELFQPADFDRSRKPKKTSVYWKQPPTRLTEIALTPEVRRHLDAFTATLPTKASRETTQCERIQELDEGVEADQSHDRPEADSNDSLSPPDPEEVDEPLGDTDVDFHQLDLDLFDYLDADDPFAFEFETGDDCQELAIQRVQDRGDSRLSRSLLLDYYRLPPSSNTHTMLVEHYFSDVCSLFSSFDSPLNPFRVTIARIWDSSPSIYYAIQSMAAAQLANTFPQMTATGLEMQKKAYECLNEELQLVNDGHIKRERMLLSILLLGLSTSWHDSGDLGLHHLTAARSLILPGLLEGSKSDDKDVQRQVQFFEESLIYWEMLIGFVSEDSMSFSPRAKPVPKEAASYKSSSETVNGKCVPHPWTGIAPKVQMLFAEVGRLVRRERTSLLSIFDPADSKERLDCAAVLEEELLTAEYPLEYDLVDPGDQKTHKHDFVVLAEAYRCAGLLEIYRVFPFILRKRLGHAEPTWDPDFNFEFEFPKPRFETRHETSDVNLWISSLALHILDTLECLPPSSGTSCLQPILLVTAASELKRVSTLDYFDIHANDPKIIHTRAFVDRRLNEFAMRLPAKPLRRMQELIQEVWRRLDAGDDAFWMDVMIEKGWQTVMG
ncbi:hypothetical protein BU16DRAFT_216251 [Lophium mytilinum]|uniref:Zn(2)-C6 fungal-type domain-containing protein n=1 Tax=Lophium mytilinum TaxID=390894 RepID=A0A6A6Q9F8_9PEZI|nr:hypothetical protein BU16DRAFT_216251 [Lophium mytilinum]